MKQLLAQLQKHLNTIIELKTRLIEQDLVIKELQKRLDDKGKDITRANNRVGEIRKLLTRYNESIFFQMFKGWLWLRDKFNYNRLKKILNNSKD